MGKFLTQVSSKILFAMTLCIFSLSNVTGPLLWQLRPSEFVAYIREGEVCKLKI